MTSRIAVAMSCVIGLVLGVATSWGQPVVTDSELVAAVDRLGDFDYDIRTEASSLIRRIPSERARPVLTDAAASHADGYVRFRALVLLVGFGGPEARNAVLDVLADPNDRLRAVAYAYFGHEPDPGMADSLLVALDTETSEFVRPALIRALSAHAEDPAVRDRLLADIDRGVDFFRGAVIESLGDRRAVYAVDPLIRIASEPGPLQDDAILALARIGDRRAVNTLAALQGHDPDLEPLVSAAAAALDVDKAGHLRFVSESLRFAAASADRLDLLTAAASGLSALASVGDTTALDVLFDVGVDAPNASRDQIALAVGTVALRHPTMMLSYLETSDDLAGAALVIRDAFDMLDEDLEEERFFMMARTRFWAAPEGSRARVVTDTLTEVLEF